MKRSEGCAAGSPSEECAGRATLVPLAEVEPEAVEWLWPGRVPMGKVTVLAGEGGVGKSLVALDIAARVSRGAPWPDQGVASFEFGVSGSRMANAALQSDTRDAELETRDSPGSVVLLTPEDDLAGTVRPRLDAAGADLARVAEVRVAGPSQVLPRRAFALAENLAAVRHAAGMLGELRLVVVDPVEAFVGRRARRGDVEGVLSALAELAEATGAAVLAVVHLSGKGVAGLLQGGCGGGAFAAARTVWAVVADTQVSERRLLMPVKNTLCAGATGLACRVVGCPERRSVPRLAWERGAVRLAPKPLGPAAGWLRDVLASGPLASREIARRARRSGLSWASLRRAKACLRVAHYCLGFQRPWLWRLPGGSGQGPCGAKVSDSEQHWATLGPDAENRAIRN